MPRRTEKGNIPALLEPRADLYTIEELDVDVSAGAINVTWAAWETQADRADTNPNPDYINNMETPGVPKLLTTMVAVPPVEVHRARVLYQDADAYELFSGVTLPGENAYDAVKRITYAKLEADDIFPAGQDE